MRRNYLDLVQIESLSRWACGQTLVIGCVSSKLVGLEFGNGQVLRPIPGSRLQIEVSLDRISSAVNVPRTRSTIPFFRDFSIGPMSLLVRCSENRQPTGRHAGLPRFFSKLGRPRQRHPRQLRAHTPPWVHQGPQTQHSKSLEVSDLWMLNAPLSMRSLHWNIMVKPFQPTNLNSCFGASNAWQLHSSPTI